MTCPTTTRRDIANLPRTYPAGYFTAVIRRTNWPPYVLQDIEQRERDAAPVKGRQGFAASVAASAQREAAAASGTGWGDGMIEMNGTRHHRKPEWIGRKAES